MGNETLETVLKTLEDKFGHTDFKSTLQKDAVLAVVQGNISFWQLWRLN